MLLKKLDLFSSPFQFDVDGVGEKFKKTALGGIFTLCIIFVSLAYFVYLLQQYFSNNMQPKTQFLSSLSKQNEMNVSEDPFYFQYFVGDLALDEFSLLTGKTYLKLKVLYVQQEVLQNKKIKNNFTEVEVKKCSAEGLQEYYCLKDYSKYKKLSVKGSVKSYFQISIAECGAAAECASSDDMQKDIYNSDNYFELFVLTYQYNSKTKEYEQSYSSEDWIIDGIMINLPKVSLVRGESIIKDGLIIQSQTTSNYPVSYTRIENYITKANLNPDISESVFRLTLDLSETVQTNKIQFPMITEVFAQFMSIFNALISLGILAKLFSETQILQDLSDVYVKQYYKGTALQIVQQNEAKEGQQEAIEEKEKPKEVLTEMQQKIENIKQSQKKIENVQTEVVFQKKSCMKRLKIQFAEMIHSKIETKEMSELEKRLTRINELSENTIGITEIYREMLQLRMAIKMILSKKQYAAIQYCGTNILLEPEEQKKTDKDNKIHPNITKNNPNRSQGNSNELVAINDNQQDENALKNREDVIVENKKLSHLEKMDQIDQIEEKKAYYFEKFMNLNASKVNGKKDNSLIDKHIVNSINQLYGEKQILQIKSV